MAALTTTAPARVDARDVKRRVDLLALIGRDTTLKKVSTTGGGEYAGPCPFCPDGGDDRFRVQPAAGRWWCRRCSPDGRWHDAIAYVMRRDGVRFPEALSTLAGAPVPPPKTDRAAPGATVASSGAPPTSGAPQGVWEYVDPVTGAILAYHVRYPEPGTDQHGKPRKAYIWWGPDRQPSGGRIKPDALPPYNVRALATFPHAPVYVTEGEPATDVLTRRGVVAVSIPGGAGQRDFRAVVAALTGRACVLWPDEDEAGRTCMGRLAVALLGHAKSVTVLTVPELPPAGDAVDYFAAGGSVHDLYALAAATPAMTPEASSSSSPPPRVADDDDDLPKGIAGRLLAARGTLTTMRERYGADVVYLAEPYIALGELAIVAGPPESMKSWLMVDLARAVHTGTLWLGSIQVPRGGVLYFEQERAKNFVYQATLLGAGWGQDLGALVAYEPCGIDLCNSDWQGEIRALVEGEAPTLVVFNSYKAIFRGRPADSADVAHALGWLGHLAERVRCAIVVVDGDNKAGALGHLRGMAAHADSVQKEYEADTVLHVERKRDDLGRGVGPARVYVGKLRYGGPGEAPAPFVVDLVPSRLGPSSSSSSSPKGDDDDDDGAGERVDTLPGGVRLLWLDEAAVDRDALPPPRNAPERVWGALPADGATRSLPDLAKAAGLTVGSTKNALTQLRGAARAENPERGQWRRALPVEEAAG